LLQILLSSAKLRVLRGESSFSLIIHIRLFSIDSLLVVQDAAGVNYSTRMKTEGIGYISGKTLGADVHSGLAVSAGGLAGGVLDQSGCNRTEARDESAGHESKKIRPIEEKESFRRLETLERNTLDIPAGVKAITVCGSEGDRYELSAKARSLNQQPRPEGRGTLFRKVWILCGFKPRGQMFTRRKTP
jgi:hypothetical protein